MSALNFRTNSLQRGVATVEFALIAAIILIPLLFGIMEFGRIAFYWNAATEVTRLGARLAVVCDIDDTTIKTRMTTLFPPVTNDMITIDYIPAGCVRENCQQVTVTINRTEVDTHIPFFDFRAFYPPFSTTLPRESMRSVFGADGAEVANPVCQ